jgi:hypothetical protein
METVIGNISRSWFDKLTTNGRYIEVLNFAVRLTACICVNLRLTACSDYRCISTKKKNTSENYRHHLSGTRGTSEDEKMLLVLNQFRQSGEGAPRSNPSVLKSSSISGQWIP